MVVDASALLSAYLLEEDSFPYIEKLSNGKRKFMCPINALEADMVTLSRLGTEGVEELELYRSRSDIDIIPFDRAMKDLAYEAWKKYGKGRHKAKLNMGDCCAYALSKYLNEPLLYKGNDFIYTDVKSVL
jgi:ribonuclease VapC